METEAATVPGAIMAAEIAEQPEMLQRIYTTSAAEIAAIAATIARRDLHFVLLAARGSSDHAALYAKYLAEVHLQLPAGLASLSTSTVYGARPDLRGVLCIAISQSGGSPDLVDYLSAARAGGATTVTVTNNVHSDLAAAAEFVIDVGAGPERAVAATKSYTAQLLAVYLLLASLPTGHMSVADVAPLAEAAQATLTDGAQVEAVVGRYRFASRIITAARGYSYATAREAALKLMETSYLAVQAFSGADLLHGPMAVVDVDTPVIAIATPGRGGAAMAPALAALRARHADLLIVGATDPEPDARVLRVATSGIVEELHPILEILPLQQLALALALERGGDPDAPRGLNKVTQTW